MLLDHAKVRDADPGQDLSGPDVDDSDWLDIAVPGDLHRALQRAGRIPDPDRGGNADECRWVEDREWWWRIPFSADRPVNGEQVELVAHGLDTYVTAYLDGVEIGRHANMFRPAGWDVTDALNSDGGSTQHVLALCFRRPTVEVRRTEHEDGRTSVARMRKAQLSYGWDFAPRRPAVGPWRPIELVRRTGPMIEAVQARTVSLSADHSEATVEIEVSVDDTRPVTVEVQIADAAGSVVATETKSVTGNDVFSFALEQPALWWTHDRGEQSLHTVAVDLRDDTGLLDSKLQSFGVRTITLRQEPDDFGRSFTFVLNGEPLTVTGSNWVPAELALAEPDPARYESLITATRDGNMNMLRIWGGGIYEHEIFYDLCDRLGVLVWQDFMWACSPFYEDSDPDWLAEVEAEATCQVRRLRSHPSLALWCGNNEVAMIAEIAIGKGVRPGERIFTEILPAAVTREDGQTSYIATSPLVGPTNSVDRHCWKVWHGIDETQPDAYVGAAAMTNDGSTGTDPLSPEGLMFVEQAGPHGYLTDLSRFTSEYGLASASDLETLKHWTDPEHVVLGDPQIAARLSLATRGPANKFELVDNAIAGEPQDIIDYCELSQLAQAEGLKVGMEHYRRGWPRCGGSLIWMLNDCWPATSWSLIDFDGRKKPAYHYARRAFAPVLASFAPEGDGVSLWLTNTSRDAVEDELVVRRLSFTGEVFWETIVPVSAAASTSRALRTFTADEVADPTTSYLDVQSRSGAIAPNRYLGARIPDLQREVVAPTADVRTNGRQAFVSVTASALSLVTHLVVPGQDISWSDDFFDLGPGETKTITTEDAFVVDDLTVRCR